MDKDIQLSTLRKVVKFRVSQITRLREMVAALTKRATQAEFHLGIAEENGQHWKAIKDVKWKETKEQRKTIRKLEAQVEEQAHLLKHAVRREAVLQAKLETILEALVARGRIRANGMIDAHSMAGLVREIMSGEHTVRESVTFWNIEGGPDWADAIFTIEGAEKGKDFIYAKHVDGEYYIGPMLTELVDLSTAHYVAPANMKRNPVTDRKVSVDYDQSWPGTESYTVGIVDTTKHGQILDVRGPGYEQKTFAVKGVPSPVWSNTIVKSNFSDEQYHCHYDGKSYFIGPAKFLEFHPDGYSVVLNRVDKPCQMPQGHPTHCGCQDGK